MKVFIAAYLALLLSTDSLWQKDFTSAQRIAKEEHRLVLINFSGSDWCIPCIRMEKEIFSDSLFVNTAAPSVVMYNADFPRRKKNALPDSIRTANEMLAERYNRDGRFPYTVLIDTNGKVVKAWDGYPTEGRERFTENVKEAGDAYHK